MAQDRHGEHGMAAAAWLGPSPAAGTVRACALYRDELARHRLITADGRDFVVATADQRLQGHGLVTGAYPVVRGYLVMMRQPLCVLVSESMREARAQHAQLVQVLAQMGTGVVRARRRSAAWRRAEAMAGSSERLAEGVQADALERPASDTLAHVASVPTPVVVTLPVSMA